MCLVKRMMSSRSNKRYLCIIYGGISTQTILKKLYTSHISSFLSWPVWYSGRFSYSSYRDICFRTIDNRLWGRNINEDVRYKVARKKWTSCDTYLTSNWFWMRNISSKKNTSEEIIYKTNDMPQPKKTKINMHSVQGCSRPEGKPNSY